jgi:hypothetical protein
MVKDQQVRRLFMVSNQFQYQYQAADAAGLGAKTARKYLRSKKLPSQLQVAGAWPCGTLSIRWTPVASKPLHMTNFSESMAYQRPQAGSDSSGTDSEIVRMSRIHNSMAPMERKSKSSFLPSFDHDGIV